MYSIVANSCFNGFNQEKFNKTFPNFFLPEEMILEIFSQLNLATLGTISCVSKEWKWLANEPILWKIVIYREIAFGNDKWAQCFGKDAVKDEDNAEEFSSLPSDDFIADCKKFKSIFPEKNVKNCLMLVRLPKTLNGGLTLRNLGQLAKKKYFPTNDKGYRFIWSAIDQELGNESIKNSYWVQMTGEILPGSEDKSYDEQQIIVAKLAEKALINYEVPDILESAVCILSQYFIDSKTRLFSDNPWVHTNCKAQVRGDQIVVGGFTSEGLNVRGSPFTRGMIGVAALKKF